MMPNSESRKRLAEQESAPDEITREHLLALCERGFVNEDHWHDRDSSRAHRQLGECYALLRAGCEFWVEPEVKHHAHWVHVHYYGFDSFEYGRNEVPKESDSFYVPTAESLAASAGRDWY